MTQTSTIEITVSSYSTCAKKMLDVGLGALASAGVDDTDTVELRYTPAGKGSTTAPTVSIHVQRDREVAP